MKIKNHPWLIICLLFPMLLQANNNNEHVLLIASYNASFPTFSHQIEGIQSVLPKVKLDIEFMDTKRFVNDSTLLKLFTESISYKLKTRKPYDAVLLADDAAFEFGLKHQNTLFKDIPLVFYGVNNATKGLEQDNNPGITGVIESVSITETIEMMLHLFPQKQEITIITDDTKTAHADLAHINAIKPKFQHIKFSTINLHHINYEVFKQEIKKIPTNSPILLLSAYQDSEGTNLTFNELVALLNANCVAPIFHLWEHGIGEGFLGGKVVSHYTQGQKAAQIVKAVLNGSDIASFKVINSGTNAFCFDQHKLDHFNIKKTQLPAGTIFLNQKNSLLRQYHKEIKLTLALFFIMLTMIIVLFINVRKRRKIQYSLSKQNDAVKKLNNDYITQNIALKEATSKAEQTEQRYKHLFYNNPISLWEEDTSELIKYIRAQSAGMSADELKTYIANNPDFLNNCLSKIKIQTVNKATLDLLGYDDKDSLIQNFKNTLTPNSIETFNQIIISLALGADSYITETEYINKQGNIISTLLYVHTFEQEAMTIISMVDTSEINAIQNELKEKIKELEDYKERLEIMNTELLEAKEKAEETDRLKSAFLANMSHEIRTPMNGILGFSNLLQNNNVEQTKRDQYIEIINKSGKRMLNTLNDIIDISKIQAGEMKLNLSEIKLASELEIISKLFNLEAHQKGLDFIFESTIQANQTIRSDQSKLLSIFNNLIKNAIKYTNTGFVKVIVKEINNQLYIEVTDSGIGIPQKRHKAVFERFTQSDIEDTEAREGSGLGLTITKSYIEMLNGEIYLTSKQGEGTTFKVYLPWENNQVKQQDSPHEKTNIEEKNNAAKILVAEDDDISFLQLEILLENYAIKRAKNGNEAIELFDKEPFDLILMDLKMPTYSGYDAIAYIREKDTQIPIIAQSAYTLERDQNRAFSLGCNDYITKPINKDLLINTVEKYINL